MKNTHVFVDKAYIVIRSLKNLFMFVQKNFSDLIFVNTMRNLVKGMHFLTLKKMRVNQCFLFNMLTLHLFITSTTACDIKKDVV